MEFLRKEFEKLDKLLKLDEKTIIFTKNCGKVAKELYAKIEKTKEEILQKKKKINSLNSELNDLKTHFLLSKKIRKKDGLEGKIIL